MDDEELIKEFIRVGRPGSVLKHDDFLEAPVFVDFDVVAICIRADVDQLERRAALNQCLNSGADS